MKSKENFQDILIQQVDNGTLQIDSGGKKLYVRLYKMPLLSSSVSFAWPHKLLTKLPGKAFIKITIIPHPQQEEMAAVGERTAKRAFTDDDVDVVSHMNEEQLNQEIDPKLLEGIRASNSVDIAVLLGIVVESEEKLNVATDAANEYIEENNICLELCQKPVSIFKQLLASPNGSSPAPEHRVDTEAMGATIATPAKDGEEEDEEK